MALPKIILDSSFVYALFRKADPDHQTVRAVFETVRAEFILPQVVLTEVAWLFNRAGGSPLVAAFLDLIAQAGLPLEPVIYDDLRRASLYANIRLQDLSWWTAASWRSLNG